jgi:hypothetical protein
MKVRIINIIFLFIFFNSNAQVFLSEGFESGSKPTGWTDVPVVYNVLWRYRTGGYSTDTVHIYTRKPPTAHTGTYNALFQKESIGSKTKLVTAPIDLSGAKRPELTFWHAQYAWGTDDFDKLRVYYKVHKDSSWHLIGSYLELTEAWTQRSIFLPPTRLSSTYYLAFEGESNWGWGEVLDDIQVVERGIIPMNFKTYTIESSGETTVPSGEKNIPITKIFFNVYGNAGQLKLDTLKFTSLNTNIADIENLGVKLYITNTPVFKPTTQIGSGVNFINGVAKFSNLNYTLTLGDKYIWLAYDIKDAANYGNLLDAKLAAKSIDLHFDTTGVAFNSNLFLQGDSVIYIIGGIRYSAPLYYHIPNTETSPTGNVMIYKSVFYDDFSSDKGWSLNGDFEKTAPQGKGGIIGGNPDPATAYSVPDVLGTDLTGLGAVQGDYENGVSSLYWAESPISNSYYYNDLRLIYKRWLNIESYDRASVQVSPDSGLTWVDVWNSQGNISEAAWGTEIVNLSSLGLDRKNGLITRFTMGPTDITDSRSGWNIDNFAIAGNYIETDVGVSRLISPLNGCSHTSHDTIKVMIKNYGANNIVQSIPVAISINGGISYITDTLKSGIPYGDSVLFIFRPTINLSVSAIYNTIVKTIMPNDDDITNDIVTSKLYIQPTIDLPAFETFESNSGIWIPGGIRSSWEWGIPESSLDPVPSGIKVWDTKLLGNYNNNEYSYIESPCYNFANFDRQLLKFSYWLSAELEKDGFNVYYSINDGKNWKLLDTNNYNWPLPWYNDTIRATGERGWVGGDASWHSIQQLIPDDLAIALKGKIRFVFQSDSNIAARGLAIDDVRIYPAPPDVGVSYIDIPKDACQFENPDSTRVYVKNYGHASLTSRDTIVVGVNFQSQPPVIDSFKLTSNLLPGDSIAYKIYLPMNISNAGIYNMFAYTMIEDDPHYYNTNNDTTWKSFHVWQNPITGLADSIYSRQPDTVVIRPRIDPQYSYLWGNNSTADTLKVGGPGYYYLTVTESVHACKTNDSVFVQLLFNDVGIDSIIWPHSSCELGTAEKVEVRIRNYGTDSLLIGDKIKVYYKIDGGMMIKDSVILSSPFRSGYTKSFLFKNAEDFSDERDYTIKSYADFGGDTLPQNDTINRKITVFGYPYLNIGNDTTIKALSYNLAADPTFTTYLWSDGDTSATNSINESGTYSLSVTDEHGCPASDAIKIWFKIRDVKAYSLLNPISSCARSGTDQVRLKIQNFGSDTIKLTDDILISYKLENDSRISQTIHVNNLLPGQTSEYLFSPLVDLTSFGTYHFNLTATTFGDLRISNDTLNKIVYTNPNPIVDLGIENGEQFKQTSYTFDAGAGPNYTYLWQDASNNRYYTATNTGRIKVLVTDNETGCYGGDTVDLYLDILDYRVASISIDNNPCQGKYENATVQVRNSGNLPRGGAQFTLSYILNNNLLFDEDYIVTSNWPANSNQTFTAHTPIDLSNSGNNQLKIIINHIGDLRPENDTLLKQLTVKSNPVVNLGGPSIYTDLPYTINAGSGQQSYLWNTGATSSTLTVTQNGVYTVTVTGTNSCETKAVVGINVEVGINKTPIEDIDVNIYPNPASDNVTIEAFFNKEGSCILEVFNVQNKLILTKEIKTSDYKERLYIGDLVRGVYFIRIRNNENYHISKLIVQ